MRFSVTTLLPSDGRDDIAVYRQETGIWYVYQSATNTLNAVVFGISTDRPVPADYDGDGKADIAVYRPATGYWYIIQSQTNSLKYANWGTGSDLPLPAAYLAQ